MDEKEFKEKARRHIFNCHLKEFPVVFELYVRAFNMDVPNMDETMAQILSIIRTSADPNTAFVMVCHHLDGLEKGE